MKNIILYSAFFISVTIFAQQKKDFALPDGNDQFAKKAYADAEANYRKSKAINQKKVEASYNLGNSIYRQNQPAEATMAFAKAAEKAKEKPQKHMAFHNLGNTYMQQKAYDKAVEAYKNALRNNPKDEQTRYNYALAKKMLKENPPKKNDNKDKKKDKDKDKKDDNKDKNKDQNKNPNQNPNKPEDKKDQNQDSQPKPGNVPKDRLQNLLDAVNNEEKKIQDRVNARKVKGKPVEEDKDW